MSVQLTPTPCLSTQVSEAEDDWEGYSYGLGYLGVQTDVREHAGFAIKQLPYTYPILPYFILTYTC